ncbi:MAG: prepilin-type N-terminal cleavage/methylation domain-containing protein [Elusimicrobiaceae bacterium]|nr:prepilin-type N-terminal cleavage/methylation domain-containing protein [Elusimicrobiaceae bacterium]
MKNKKKAFTLTELLVVVIVIGVLSAVVLPKFSKVIETRKTTEAEELMASVRTEQEKRCALDKPYLTQMSELTDVVKTASTKNYQINLQDKGIKAASKGKYSYTLQMPSYADGRICCDGDDCEKLNKNYPSCTGFSYEPSPDSCAGTVTPVEPEIKNCSGSDTQACGCQGKGTQSRTCNTTTGEWSDWGACSISDACECTGTKPDASQDCNKCGTQTRTVTCDSTTGTWKTGSWGTCSKTEAECTVAECVEGETRGSQTCNSCGTRTTEKCVNGKWTSSLGECSKTREECSCRPKGIKTTKTVSGGSWSGGTESFWEGSVTYISHYECQDGNGNPCEGCTLPSCNDSAFFSAHLGTCCKTEMGEHPSCCRHAVNVKEACGYVPPGQFCNKFTCSWKNDLGHSCMSFKECNNNMVDYEIEGDLPDDYVPTPDQGGLTGDFTGAIDDVDTEFEVVDRAELDLSGSLLKP